MRQQQKEEKEHRAMSTLVVGTEVAKGENQAEFAAGPNKILKFKGDHPQVFPGLR
jgi:hypothetical protein